jgi:hypothetical protein
VNKAFFGAFPKLDHLFVAYLPSSSKEEKG